MLVVVLVIVLEFGAGADYEDEDEEDWGSAPFVLGVFALEFLFDPRVVLAPEAGEVLGDLDGALAGGEDVDEDGDAVHRDAGGGVDAVELLDAQGDVGRVGGVVGDFGGAAVGEGEAFGGVLLQEGLLGGAEPAFHDGLGGLVLEVFGAEGAVADLLDEVAAVFGR